MMRAMKTIALAGIGALAALALVACNPAGSSAPAGTPAPSATPPPLATATPEGGPPPELAVTFSDGNGQPVEGTVDGNALRVTARLSAPAAAAMSVFFSLAGRGEPFAECALGPADDACSALVRADGWAWEDGKLVGSRGVQATVAGEGTLVGDAAIPVAPKPIVLVHGLNSDHTSWINWIKPGGYLDEVGVKGYAVDDGQFGTAQMNTGNPAKPLEGTNSIAENALVAADYIEAVRANTGAERVDLVAHSLGGLISRYYVQNLMPVVQTPGLPDVPVANQLFMAGTPNSGTECGRIPASLGLFEPASTQITPEYVTQVFNPAVSDRRSVPFFAIAGDAITKTLALRCTRVPTDRMVAVESVLRGVAVAPDQIVGLHADLNNGRPSFEHIFASLARSPEDYPIAPSEVTIPVFNPLGLVQTTVVQGGTLQPGQTVTVTIPIDQARDATFLLYAPGSDVTMIIKTVSGKILTEETPKDNPKVSFERVSDASLPLSLGYGVLEPKAGAWEIGLTARTTPPGGGPFAVVATLDTDLHMTAEAQPAAVQPGEEVVLRAMLDAPTPPQKASARASIRRAGDSAAPQEVELLDDGQHGDGAAGDGTFAAAWTPADAGEYTAVIATSGIDAAGNPFERLAVLGVSVAADEQAGSQGETGGGGY